MIITEYKSLLVKSRISATEDYERLAMQGRSHTGYAMVLEVRLQAIEERLAKIEGICDSIDIDTDTGEPVKSMA